MAAAGLLAALAPASAAQVALPQAPGGAGDTVKDTVQQPLPGPAEGVVRDSPAAPLRDSVRDTVGGATGGGGRSGGGGGGSQGSAPGSAPARARSGASGTGVRSGEASGTAGGSAASGGRRDSAAARRAARRRAAARRARARERRERDRGAAAAADRGGASSERADGGVSGRLRDIVEVVPGWVTAALAGLGLAALAFAARMLAERRRAGRLEGDRKRLARDVGVLQGALLPEVPDRIGALTASVAYRPAEGLAAGGDFYDVFEFPDGRVAVMVGDVSGHGQDALMRTASVRHHLSAYLRAGTDPRGALAAAGELLPMGDEGRFTTVLLAVYDPENGTLTYSSAGHPAPIFTGPGAHEPITCASSPPVGVGIATGVRQTTVSLPPGAAACLFTDGVVEARCGEDRLGRERLAELVADLPDREPAAALLERVDAVADTAGDDLAVCIVRATAGPKRVRPRVEELEVGAAEGDLARAERLLAGCGLPEAQATGARDELVLASPALLRITFAKQPRVEVLPLPDRARALLSA